MIGIKIIKREANSIRKKLIADNQLNKSYKVRSDEDYVYLPLIEDYDEYILNQLIENYPIEVDDYDFVMAEYRPTSFMDFIKGNISNDKIEDIRKSFDIIGDIVILEIPEELEDEKEIIGQAALKFTKRKSVYYKKSKVQGVTRTRELEFLAGIDNLETIHKEFGLRFKLNPSTVYFSPRLATERSRIVNQVCDGEVIIDFFAGIGSFPISIASVKNAEIYSIDINPEAYKYVNENIKLNKLVGKVIPLQGDVREVIKNLPHADRILMNLPGTAVEFLPLAVEYIKDGGIINYYEFNSSQEAVIDHINDAVGDYSYELLNIRKVRSQSPGVWHFGVDVKVLKK